MLPAKGGEDPAEKKTPPQRGCGGVLTLGL
jgi:hypothetical protein